MTEKLEESTEVYLPSQLERNMWCSTCGKDIVGKEPLSDFGEECDECQKWWKDNMPTE